MKAVIRIDHNRTHGFYARIYRGRNPYYLQLCRSFADRQYGGRQQAYRAAVKWIDYVEEHVPPIPTPPRLRVANARIRPARSLGGRRHYLVYLPDFEGYGARRIELSFSTLDEQRDQRKKADQLVEKHNRALRKAYTKKFKAWKQAYKKCMEFIRKKWPEMKHMPL